MGIAGALAAVNRLTRISEQAGQVYEGTSARLSGRRLHFKTRMSFLRAYDHVLSAAILDELVTLPGVCTV